MKLLLSLLAVSSLLRADFDPHNWHYRTPISFAAQPALSQIPLDSSVYSRSFDQLNDLRIVGDRSEIPYQLQVSAPVREERNLPLKILNKSVVPGRGLQATLDLNGHSRHNQLRIATAQKNFKETVRIETSDDVRHWNLVRSEALIFDISRQDRRISDLTVEYPVSTRRYVRLTIPGWTDPAFLESAWLLEVRETKAVRDQVASLQPAVTQDPSTHSTSYTFDIGFKGQAFDQLLLSVGSDLFFHNVEVFTSNDRKDWTFAGAGVLSNQPDDLHLQMQIPEQWSRHVKLVIANGDSPPVTITSVSLFAPRRTLRFSSSRPGHYWLYSGNASAQTPQYDLTQILASTASAVPVTLGAPEINPEYKAPSLAWSDRNPHLLLGFVIAAAALMASLALRLLIRLKTA